MIFPVVYNITALILIEKAIHSEHLLSGLMALCCDGEGVLFVHV